MVNLWRYMLIEWKLLVRGIGFWLLLGCAGGLLYLSLSLSDRPGDLGRYIVDALELYMQPLLLLASLLAASVARRGQITGTSVLIDSLPYRTTQLLTARVLALSAVVTVFALIPTGFYAMMALIRGIGWTAEVWGGIAVLSSYVIPILFAAMLSYGLAAMIRGRWSYLLILLIGLFFIGFYKTSLSYFMPLHMSRLFDVVISDPYKQGYYSELWGFTADRPFWIHRALILLLAIAITGWVASAMLRRRREPGWLLGVLLSVAAAAGGLIGAGGYMSIWAERVQYAESELQFYERVLQRENWDGNERLEQDYLAGVDLSRVMANTLTDQHKLDLEIGQQYAGLRAESYQLRLAAGLDHSLQVEGRMIWANESKVDWDKFPFVLKHHFHVTELRINGSVADWSWQADQDVIWVTPAEPVKAGSLLTMEIQYEGKIDDWRYFMGMDPAADLWRRFAFVDSGKLWLPASYGWYPQPGNHRLSEYAANLWRQNRRVTELREKHAKLPAADFTVIWESASEGMALYAVGEEVLAREEGVSGGERQWTFKLSGPGGVTLVGGPLQERIVQAEDAELRLVANRQIAGSELSLIAERMARLYTETDRLMSELGGVNSLNNSNNSNNLNSLDGSEGMLERMLPQQLSLVRADYPYELDYLMLEKPRYTYSILPMLMTLSEFVSGNYDLYWIGHLWNESGLSITESVYSSRFYEIITAYVQKRMERAVESNTASRPLLDPSFRRPRHMPESTLILVNQIYEKDSDESFLIFLRELYGLIGQPGVTESDVVQFIQDKAGKGDS